MPTAARPTRRCWSTSGPSGRAWSCGSRRSSRPSPTTSSRPQAVVQNALAASGVPAPAPSVVVDDPEWIGAPFLAMPLVRGDIAGPAPAFDDYVTAAGTDAAAAHARRVARHRRRRPRRGLARRRPGRGVGGHHDTRRVGPLDGLRRVVVRGRSAPRAGRGAGLVRVAGCRPRANRSCSGATCVWATSCSTRSGGCGPCSTGISPPSDPPRWTWPGTSASRT